jgi:hypothetical protein
MSPLVAASPHLTATVNRTLELALQPSQGAPTADLGNAMSELCQQARAHGVRAEELILLFKKMWATRPELRTMSREETGRLFDAVVTMCLDAYYDGAR